MKLGCAFAFAAVAVAAYLVGMETADRDYEGWTPPSYNMTDAYIGPHSA